MQGSVPSCASAGSAPATAKAASAGTSRPARRSATRPTRIIVGRATSADCAGGRAPASLSQASVARRTARQARSPRTPPQPEDARGGREAARMPHRRLARAEVTVDEVVLLQPPQPLADLARLGGADAVHGLKLAERRPDQRSSPPRSSTTLRMIVVGEPRDVRRGRDTRAARRSSRAGSRPAGARALGEPVELQQPPVRQRVPAARARLGAVRRRRRGSRGRRRALARHARRSAPAAACRISRPSRPSSTQSRSISSRHARRHLGALQHDEHVVEDDGVLELQRGQPGQHLVEALAVRLERRRAPGSSSPAPRRRVELVAAGPT